MPDNDQPAFEALEPLEAPKAVTRHEVLRQEGVCLNTPGNLHRDQVRGCLWELVYALAARRVYLHSTDHLSDEELYRWLYAEWLSKDACDLPAEDCSLKIDPVGSEADANNQTWLRYYADEEARRNWRQSFPDDTVPSFEPLPYDRDRWLPIPFGSIDLENPDETFEAAGEPDEGPLDELRDPLRLQEVEDEIRAEKPVFEPADSPSAGDDPYENGAERGGGGAMETWQCPHTELVRSGVCLPPPDEMTDEMLPSKLWELLHELACRGFYLLHTDHLSDHELYSRLWREDLRAPAILPGRTRSGGWFHDLTGAGVGEQRQLWLAYYASDAEREAHALAHPDDPLPPRSAFAVRRDHRVPKGPF